MAGRLFVIAGIVAVAAAAAPALGLAQGLELEAPPADRLRDGTLGLPLDRSPDLQRPAVPHAQGFIEGLSTRTETGRAGLAGWTSPAPAVGSRGASEPNSSGWFGFGFAIEWGGPARPRGEAGEASGR
jgi:hypothetical protein